MILDELKAAVQPLINGDFDEVYRQFCATSGSTDAGAFLAHLRDQNLLTAEEVGIIFEVYPELSPSGTLAGGPGGAPTLATTLPTVAEPPPPPKVRSADATLAPAGPPPVRIGTAPPASPRASGSTVVRPSATPSPTPRAAAPSTPVPPSTPVASSTPAASEPAAPTATPADPAPAAPESSAPTPVVVPPPPLAPPSVTSALPRAATASSEASESLPPSARQTLNLSKVLSNEPRSSNPTWADADGQGALPSGLRRAGKRTGGGSSTGGSTGGSTSGSVPLKPVMTGRGFRMVGDVGEGAMGKVMLAEDLDLGRTVAFKEMSPEIANKPQLAGKFFSEAQITAQLDHPNIVPIYTLEQPKPGRLAYSMKLIKGKTLEKLVEECVELHQKGQKHLDDDHSLETRLDHFLRVCDAIHYAHSRGVVHRDLKPENIMIGPYGEVYVMDWGIAKVLPEPTGKSATGWVVLEQPPPEEGDVVIGTPQYMSPEQAEGRTSTLGPPSDQYSLGLILYELVSLNVAVTGNSPMAVVLRQQEGQKNKLVHRFGRKIPTELRAIIEKATQKDAARRYADVDQLSEDIKRYLRGDAVKARPDGILQRVLRWISKHREWTLMGILASFGLFLFVTVLSQAWYQYQRIAAEAREQRLTEILSAVGTQAARVDGEFVRYQGLLSGIAIATSEMLEEEGAWEQVSVSLPEHFDAATTPEAQSALGLAASSHYGQSVSLTTPVFLLPSGQFDATAPRAAELVGLGTHLRRNLLRSHSEESLTWPESRSQRLLLDVGVPIAWVHVGLSDGVYVGYPGHGGYSGTFDPRTQPWYQLATGPNGEKVEQGVRGPQWGAPYVDPAGLGIVLPSSVLLVDRQDEPLGVAAVELTFDYVIDELLQIPAISDDSEAFLLDEQGRIVVRSSQAGRQFRSSLSGRTIRLPTFEVTEVVDAVTRQGRTSGYVETEVDGQDVLVAWQRMHSLGWTYVVQGPSRELLR
jgi:serine/threonine protein kinase